MSLILIAVVAVGLTGCNKLKARDLLVKGTQAFKNGQTDQAIEDFKQAKELDPDLLMAQLYLGTAYQSEYIPGATTAQNTRVGNQALAEYQGVLSVDPNNLDAIDRIGSLIYSMASTPFSVDKFRESQSYWQKHIQLKPDDAEPYYWMGQIDWTIAFRANAELRSAYNHANPRKQVQDEQPLPASLRDEFVAKQGKTVDEGIDYLKKALARKQDYDDADVYLNLIYRQKADMVTDPKERDDLLKQASDLMDQVKQIKQKKAAAQPR